MKRGAQAAPGAVDTVSGTLPSGVEWNFAYDWGNDEQMRCSSDRCQLLCSGERATAKAFEGEDQSEAYWFAVYVDDPALPDTEVGPSAGTIWCTSRPPTLGEIAAALSAWRPGPRYEVRDGSKLRSAG